VLAPYRAVLRRPGALAFASGALVGRMWLSMAPLGIVLLVSAKTGRYGTAGGVSATFAVVGALTGPYVGRLADRVGHGRLLRSLTAVFVAGSAALVALALTSSPVATLYVAAAIAGATAPPLTSMVRARWTALLGGGAELQTAFALESALDEVVFMVGPVLATALATSVTSSAGLIAAVGLTVIGTLAFAAQRRTEPPRAPAENGAGGALAVPGLRVVLAASLLTGGLFGALDVSMVAFTTEHGHRGAAGALLALVALGSFCGGLWYGGRHWRATAATRFVVSSGILAVCGLTLSAAPGIPTMAGAALVTGVAIAPSLISSSLLTQQLAPEGTLTEAFALLGGAIGVGFAVGAPISGHLVDVAGPHVAFLTGAAAAAAGAGVAFAGRHRLVAPRPGDARVADPAAHGIMG
jgi:MFS family permease